MHHRAAPEIVSFDPHAATARDWARFHAWRRARQAEELPGDPVAPDGEFEEQLLQEHPLHELHHRLALRDGEIVGSLMLRFRRKGSPDSATHAPFVDVLGGVLRARRRQGIGMALLAAVHEFMREHGQTVATMKVQSSDGDAFMEATGAAVRLRSTESRLDLESVDWEQLAGWEAQAGGDNLILETHAGRVPLERLASLVTPYTQLLADVPMDALDRPRPRMDLQTYLLWYQEMDRRDGAHLLVLLRHDHVPVAVCDASWDARFPDRVQQQFTGVAAAWRGRGLARGIKAAMLRLIRDRHPQVRTVITSNARSNAPMLSVNRHLGFAMHRQETLYQISRDQMARALAIARS